MSLFQSLEVLDNFYGVTTTKGDIIVNDGTKNTRLPIGADNYVLAADSTTATGLKWVVQTGGSSSIDYFQYVLSTVPISTNSTTPINITEFQNTPPTGNFLMITNITYSLSRTNRNLTIGFYKNGVLISGSARTVSAGAANIRTVMSLQFIAAFNGTDIFTVRYSVNNTDTTATIHEGNTILVKFTNASQLNVTNNNFSINSISPIAITGLTTTPALGVYLILFNTTYTLQRNNRTATFGLYIDNSLITGSARTVNAALSVLTPFQSNITAAFSGTQTVSVRVNSSNIDNDVTVYDRNLILIPLQ